LRGQRRHRDGGRLLLSGHRLQARGGGGERGLSAAPGDLPGDHVRGARSQPDRGSAVRLRRPPDEDRAMTARGRLREAFRSGRLVFGASIVGFFVLVAIFGPFFASNPNLLSTATYQAPSIAHWLGTTQTGQDVFAQLVVSTRASLEIGVGAGLLATVISIVIGITGGYVGGVVDEALSLVSNVVLVIPTFPLIIVTFAYVKQGNLTALILVIALTSWAASARVLRAQTLSVRNREYVLAARAGGERAWRIILVEILPNELPIIVSQFIFAMIFAILTQATIAFLG